MTILSHRNRAVENPRVSMAHPMDRGKLKTNMADKADKNQQQEDGAAGVSELKVEDDLRLRYIGFDVGPSKIGELFKSDKEREGFLARVRESRQNRDALRDTSNFREARISDTERYIILAASFAVILFFFLPVTPWISGYFETRTEVTIGGKAHAGGAQEPTGGILSGDSNAVAPDASAEDTVGALAATSDSEAQTPPPEAEKTGFQELQTKRTRTRIEKTPFNLSGAQVIARIGSVSSDIFSSGIVLQITAVLFAVFVLLIFAAPLYIIFSLLTIKGDADVAALKLKKALRFGWYPVMLWALMLALSFIGADYGFDSSEALKQVGESYGAPTFLGMLGSGFYISLAGCMFAGSKSVEI
jgi:hypothetical protein